jgi:hypothetical protein
MPATWELVVSWCGEPIRAELLQGVVRVDAGGPTPDDVPLPLDDRAPLARGDGGAGLTLLAVDGATWSVDGAPAAGAEVALADGIARLVLGDLEVAVKRTTPAPRLPRFAPMGGALLGAATCTAAYVLVGLTLYTDSPSDRCLCGLEDFGHSPVTVTRSDVPAPPSPPVPSREFPRWMAPERTDEGARPDQSDERPSRGARSARRRAGPARTPGSRAEEPYSVPADLSEAVLGDQVVRLEDLADEVVVRHGVGDRPGQGASRGVGSCDGAHFAALVARHGRQTAIVACATAPELGHAPTRRPGHNVVLRERDGSRLAPEVWTWSTSPAGRPPR